MSPLGWRSLVPQVEQLAALHLEVLPLGVELLGEPPPAVLPLVRKSRVLQVGLLVGLHRKALLPVLQPLVLAALRWAALQPVVLPLEVAQMVVLRQERKHPALEEQPRLE